MKQVSSGSELNNVLNSAGRKLVVVDFFATWCGPCRTLAPILEELEKKHKSVIFAKMDVDQAKECAGSYEISAMPTIVFMKNGSEVGRIVGADVGQIQALIKKHDDGNVFSGVGQTLGGSSSGSSSSAYDGATPFVNTETVDGPGGACQIQIRLPDGSMVRGDFEPSHTLQQVYEFVRANLNARGINAPGFSLMTNFPKMVYEGSALQQTLEEAKLAPRAQLIAKT
ncbi:hypothetical protein BX616_005582 [Lobosporangium transversale]|uniref:Thioredoxin-like protein n=1 Tax=Lobosporangium transversale TaxID=64571 RepID=A0A1Y2GCY9_9FUNG|nr:thioredoxin-like protein [Lobosporangium transversale]KAF9915702.1 hypothetical protein BX616_005582 [Lobosporangium transversale]ORZ07300.1 thioredoxin-like protein [Lobosporangium transversale]|eukprot:XP_021877963.1 thioredoxin-like protein [Lobosporangium transversale]